MEKQAFVNQYVSEHRADLVKEAEIAFDAKKLSDKMLEIMPETVNIGYVDYRDELTDEQVAGLIGTELNFWETPVGDDFMEYESDNFYASLPYELEDLATKAFAEIDSDFEFSEVFEAFKHDYESYVLITDHFRDRNTFDAISELAHNTPNKLFRVKIADIVGTERDYEIIKVITDLLGNDSEQNKNSIQRSLDEVHSDYRFEVYVLATLDVEKVISATGKVTFIDPILWIGDLYYNGAGFDTERLEGRITVDIDDIQLDSKPVYGYSIDDIHGFIHSAFDTEIEIS